MLNHFRHTLVQYLRHLRHRRPGVTLGRNVVLGPRVGLLPGFSGHRGHIVAGDGCRLETGALLEAWAGRIELGRHVFVGPYSVIYGHGGVRIGDDTLIAMHCRIVSSNHTVSPVGTTMRTQPDELRPVEIGRDVWLGAGVTILGGVTIGDGCIVGAGSVVTKDLPPGSICHGVPAAVVGSRASC